jgi:hypothetical protein
MFWKVYMFIAEKVYYNLSERLELVQGHCAEPDEYGVMHCPDIFRDC